ncbi:hypothetical protein [Methylobacterium goesingense]|uniref:Uncharacterized protein n=1 Tax=Methylobacterium goesingense TaxID=243690 RepID=A0ABV2L8V3_9HYPH|nr:hypothetical protein [Methylobacterium goesingense]GJD76723.1 hypothetical protein CFIICLFH_4982 [Methylobacterium goesingense]
MNPAPYVGTYLNIPAFFADGSSTTIAIKNYLQDGKPDQSARAQAAKGKLLAKISGELKKTPKGVFEMGGYEFCTLSIARVFMGKGAPDEIQDVLWLASRFNLIDSSTVRTYCDRNIGIDCGGFVANLWGIGHPENGRAVTGSTGFSPRSFWNFNKAKRRKHPGEISVGDAIIHFCHMPNDDTDMASMDPKLGGEAFHIGTVAGITVKGDRIDLTVAESSGAKAASGGNGVSAYDKPDLATKIAKNLVYVPSASGNRMYFVGKDGAMGSYMPFESY